MLFLQLYLFLLFSFFLNSATVGLPRGLVCTGDKWIHKTRHGVAHLQFHGAASTSPVFSITSCPSKDGRFARCCETVCELCVTLVCLCLCLCVCVRNAKDAHRSLALTFLLLSREPWWRAHVKHGRGGGKTGRGSYDTWTRSVAIHWPNMQRVMPFYVASASIYIRPGDAPYTTPRVRFEIIIRDKFRSI